MDYTTEQVAELGVLHQRLYALQDTLKVANKVAKETRQEIRGLERAISDLIALHEMES